MPETYCMTARLIHLSTPPDQSIAGDPGYTRHCRNEIGQFCTRLESHIAVKYIKNAMTIHVAPSIYDNNVPELIRQIHQGNRCPHRKARSCGCSRIYWDNGIPCPHTPQRFRFLPPIQRNPETSLNIEEAVTKVLRNLKVPSRSWWGCYSPTTFVVFSAAIILVPGAPWGGCAFEFSILFRRRRRRRLEEKKCKTSSTSKHYGMATQKRKRSQRPSKVAQTRRP